MRRLPCLLPLVLIAGCGSSAGRGGSRPSPGTPDLDFPVGSFRLTERSGRAVTEKDLHGKVWVASFVFTHCTGPCPSVTATVGRLQRELADRPDVRFVTFTVDPDRDGPARLRQYAEIFRADPDRWLFLTGDEATIHSLMKDRFKQAVGKRPAGAKEGDEFDHSTRLAVVDKRGVIRATFDGVHDDRFPAEEFEENLRRLREKVAALAAE